MIIEYIFMEHISYCTHCQTPYITFQYSFYFIPLPLVPVTKKDDLLKTIHVGPVSCKSKKFYLSCALHGSLRNGFDYRYGPQTRSNVFPTHRFRHLIAHTQFSIIIIVRNTRRVHTTPARRVGHRTEKQTRLAAFRLNGQISHIATPNRDNCIGSHVMSSGIHSNVFRDDRMFCNRIFRRNRFHFVLIVPCWILKKVQSPMNAAYSERK